MNSGPLGSDDSGEIQKVREETRQALRRGAYFYVVMVATVLMAAGVSLVAARQATKSSERKLCAVVITTDDAYHRMPVDRLSQAGKEQAANFSRLRQELGCAPYKGD